MSVSRLPDPRRFAAPLASNFLLTLLDDALRGDAGAGELLRQRLLEQLDRGEQLPLAVGLALAPSAPAHHLLWLQLCRVLREQAEQHWLALPVVWVLGANRACQLPAELSDAPALLAGLRANGLPLGDDWQLLPQLVSVETLAGFDATALYQLGRGGQGDVQRNALMALPGEAITVQREAVELRFLLLQGTSPASLPASMRWAQWLMQQLHQQFAHEGLTLFAIPRPPQPLAEAQVSGARARHEIALQVHVSNSVRAVRQRGKVPQARLAAGDDGSLRFWIEAEGEIASQPYLWPLTPLDDLAAIEAFWGELLADCQVCDATITGALQSVLATPG